MVMHMVNMRSHGQYENYFPTLILQNSRKLRKFFKLTLDSVSRFAIVLLIPVSSISLYPLPSCFTMLGFGGFAAAGAGAFGTAGGGTRREEDYKNVTSLCKKLMFIFTQIREVSFFTAAFDKQRFYMWSKCLIVIHNFTSAFIICSHQIRLTSVVTQPMLKFVSLFPGS